MELKEVLGYFLPAGTLDYFDIKEIKVKAGKKKYMGKYGFDDEYTVILEEKNNLPLFGELRGGKVRTKGYSEKLLDDFPIRGRKTILKFRVRKYQKEGEEKIYQRRFSITAEKVSMTEEFAFFFEGEDRDRSS